MSANYFSNDKNNRPTLRRSQTITVFGVGAIADLPNASVMISSIDRWGKLGKRVSDPRLEKKLGAPFFMMPPDTEQSKDGIPAIRFPQWMRCRKCGSLRSAEEWRNRFLSAYPAQDFDFKPVCDICRVPLIPSRFIVACRLGHIDDFPYKEWVHDNLACSSPDIKYVESGKSASLAGIMISCKTCGKKKSMRNAFNKQLLADALLTCKGSKPWAGEWNGGCGEKLTGLLRGGTNVHFPIVKSSILIPPFTSDSLKTRIANSDTWQLFESQENGVDESNMTLIAGMIAQQIEEDNTEVLTAIKEMLSGEDPAQEDRSEEDYRYDEYRAFLGNVQRAKDFEIEPLVADSYQIPGLKSIVLVKKLRELRVQTGFSRIRPPEKSEESESDQDDGEIIEEVSVSNDRSVRWRPAYEVRGEGIFLEFDSAFLSNWSSTNAAKSRSKTLIDRFNRKPDAFAVIEKMTPEYLFLHTLSHLLIRQLSFECGYGSSALRERIYCSSDNSRRRMTGILIYTADGDADGTMGGLVRQGRSDYFPRTLYEAISGAKWCSSDPLCIEAKGQGYQAMNLAACHACAMLPETSCEIMNRYLDRAAVIGTLNQPDAGLYTSWNPEA